MKKDKLISIIISFAVMLTIFASSCTVSAEGEPTVTGSRVNGKPGETIDVVFSLNDNIGLADLDLGITYDWNFLTAVSVINLTETTSFQSNIDNKGVVDVKFNQMSKDITSRNLFSISFNIKGNITEKMLLSLPITRSISTSSDGNIVNLKTVGATVSIDPTSILTPDTSSNPEKLKLNLVKSSYELEIGEQYDVLQLVTPNTIDNSKITFESANTKIVSVTKKGIAKAIKAGKTVITIKSGESDNALKITIIVKPDVPVSEILIYDSEISIGVGDTKVVKALVAPENATKKKITFKSSDPKIATIDGQGNVKGIKAGIVFITATSENEIVSNKCIVNVVTKSTTDGNLVSILGKLISVDKKPISNYKLQLVANNVEVTTDKSGMFEFSKISSGQDVLCLKEIETGKIIATGTVLIRNKGKILLQVVLSNNILSVQDITDIAVPVSKIELSESKVKLNVDSVYQIIAIATPKDATNKLITFKSSDEDIATVASDGTITAITPGACKIVASSADGLVNSTCTLTVELVQSKKYSFLIIAVEVMTIALFIGFFIIKYRKYKKKEILEA